MEAASNNLSFLFPKSIVRAVERFYQWLFEHATASRNISCGGPKKDGFSSLSVLPLNETGGKLTYQVIVTNIAKGELSVALPPFHCGGLKKTKKKTLTAPAVCIDMNLFPDKTRNSLQLGRIPPAVHGWHGLLCCCRLAFEWGSLSVMMKWKSSSAVNTCTQKVIGDFATKELCTICFQFHATERQPTKFDYVCC